MEPTKDFIIKKGDTFRRQFVFTTGAGFIIDITASTFKLFVTKRGSSRKNPKLVYDTTAAQELKIIGTNQLEFTLTDETTLVYPSDAEYYYLCQFFPDGTVRTKVEGNIKVTI